MVSDVLASRRRRNTCRDESAAMVPTEPGCRRGSRPVAGTDRDGNFRSGLERTHDRPRSNRSPNAADPETIRRPTNTNAHSRQRARPHNSRLERTRIRNTGHRTARKPSLPDGKSRSDVNAAPSERPVEWQGCGRSVQIATNLPRLQSGVEGRRNYVNAPTLPARASESRSRHRSRPGSARRWHRPAPHRGRGCGRSRRARPSAGSFRQ